MKPPESTFQWLNKTVFKTLKLRVKLFEVKVMLTVVNNGAKLGTRSQDIGFLALQYQYYTVYFRNFEK